MLRKERDGKKHGKKKKMNLCSVRNLLQLLSVDRLIRNREEEKEKSVNVECMNELFVCENEDEGENRKWSCLPQGNGHTKLSFPRIDVVEFLSHFSKCRVFKIIYIKYIYFLKKNCIQCMYGFCLFLAHSIVIF